jgi:TPR repeat protein
MNRGALLIDVAEQIKWWDALDALEDMAGPERGLQMARECRHPDAVWLASLFPAGVTVTMEGMEGVMLQHGDDPRAMHLAVVTGGYDHIARLERAAAAGYAPAQAALSYCREGPEQLEWAQRAALQGNRAGIMHVAWMLQSGEGCEKDVEAGVELYRQAAELGSGQAQHAYALSFGQLDWRRFMWLGRAAEKGVSGPQYVGAVLRLLPCFEDGQQGRILHTVAPGIRAAPDVASGKVFGLSCNSKDLARLLQLHRTMMESARAAIDCWSAAARRLGLVKDMRVMIAKTVWEEPWRWAGKKGQ